MTIHLPPCASADAQVFSLADVHPSDPHRTRAEQARDVFERMDAALRNEKLTFAHVIRTLTCKMHL